MLKPYIFKRECKVDDEEWGVLGEWVVLLEEDGSDFHPRFLEETSLTFDEVWRSTDTFCGIYADQTFFRKRHLLWIHFEKKIEPLQVFEGGCEKISFRDTREEAPYTTLAYLMKHSPSDLVMRYIRENGLAVCPIK